MCVCLGERVALPNGWQDFEIMKSQDIVLLSRFKNNSAFGGVLGRAECLIDSANWLLSRALFAEEIWVGI